MLKNTIKLTKSISPSSSIDKLGGSINKLGGSIDKLSKLPDFSYGKFLQENPNATRKERREAIKIFLNHVRKNI